MALLCRPRLLKAQHVVSVQRDPNHFPVSFERVSDDGGNIGLKLSGMCWYLPALNAFAYEYARRILWFSFD